MRSNQVCGEPTTVKVTNIAGRVEFLVGVGPGHAFFGGANIYLVILNTHELLVDPSDNPCSAADARSLQAQGEDEEDVGDGIINRGNGEGRGGILPCDGGKNGGDDGTVEAKVEELLGTIGDAEDVVALTRRDVEAGDGADSEETGNNGQLTANHESREVASISSEEDLGGLLAEPVGSALFHGELGHAEECDLHTLETADDKHEEEEHEDGKWRGDGGVLHGNHGVAVEERDQNHGHAERKDGQGHEDSGPEEREGESSLGLFVGDDGLTRYRCHGVLDKVCTVHDTGELDAHRRVEGEEGEVIVDVVNHRVCRNDLRPELTKDTGEHNHSDSDVKEDELDTVGHAEHIDLGVEGLTALVDNEDHHKHHELTSHEVPVEVVALEGQGAVLVSDGVAVLVEYGVDGGETDEGGLLALDHRKPSDGRDLLLTLYVHTEYPGKVSGQNRIRQNEEHRHQCMTYANKKADPWVSFVRDTRIPSEHEGADQYDGEDQDPDGSDVFDNEEGGDLLIV